MATFGQDKKWIEAKRIVGNDNSWLEVISCYNSIGGKGVFVYSVIEGQKRLIVDVLDDNHVLLFDSNKNLVVEQYETILNSKKLFKYNDRYTEVECPLENKIIKVTIET